MLKEKVMWKKQGHSTQFCATDNIKDIYIVEEKVSLSELSVAL